MTKQEIIDETVAYIKANGRSLARLPHRVVPSCRYTTHLPDGRTIHCAVGRCLTPDALSRAVEDKGVNGITGEYITDLDPLLLPQYHGHSIHFWQTLQTLHDTGSFWNSSNNLTPSGQSFIEQTLLNS